MANIITFFRIVCGIALLLFRAFSPSFYTLYIAAGISDMIDGTLQGKQVPSVRLAQNLILLLILFLLSVA